MMKLAKINEFVVALHFRKWQEWIQIP